MSKGTGNYHKIEVNPGDRFNNLTVIKEVDRFVQPSGQSQRGFLCKCECGNTKKVRLSHLRHNRVKSCGCGLGERHGDDGKPLHTIWRGMVNRCTRESYKESHLYLDRGITICEEWKGSYLKFKKWALNNGYKEGLTIDRIDNNGDYDPSNCRFVTQKVNNCNRRNTLYVNYKGKKRSFALLLAEKGLAYHYTTIWRRIERGWAPERAIDAPIRKGNYVRNKEKYKQKLEAL